MSGGQDPDGREVFRPLGAVIVWWAWALFAAVAVPGLALLIAALA